MEPSRWLTLGISVFSFLISLSTWIYTFATQRKRFSVKVLFFRTSGFSAYMFLSIENKSRLPIAITNFSLLFDSGVTANCTPIPKEVISARDNQNRPIPGARKDSTALPIQIASLGAAPCIVLFEDIPEEIPLSSMHLNLRISTNRGRIAKIKLQLPQDWASRTDIP